MQTACSGQKGMERMLLSLALSKHCDDQGPFADKTVALKSFDSSNKQV